MDKMEKSPLTLNSITPAVGAKTNRRRVGRGIGSGLGKTCGRGHKGQKSRAGGFHKVGFEGGQMPMQRRIPKRGFVSLAAACVTLRLSDLNRIEETDIDLLTLKNYELIKQTDTRVKLVLTGELTKKVNLKDIEASAGAKAAVEKAGGSVTLTPVREKVRKLPKKNPA